MEVAFKIALLIVLILINAFFAASEMAIISLNDTKIRHMAEDGHKKAKKVLKLTAESSAFLSTIQIGVTLAGFLTSASASENFASMLNDQMISWFGITNTTAQSVVYGVSVVIITLITSCFSLIFGELVPKKIAIQKCESVSFAVVGPLLVIKKVLSPAVKFLSACTNGVVRLFGMDPNSHEELVTEEEIRMMVDVGEEKGVIEESQREMINNIFEFDDITVADVMQHRTDIAAVDIDEPIKEVVALATEEGYSRLPVFHEDLDDIVGIVYVKDFLPFVGKRVPETATPRDIMRPVYHVPESKKCGELFREMTEKRIQMAIVVDEYGGTAGLVTLEDLVESIVGNIQDEFDNEQDEIRKLDDGLYSIDGTADIEDVSEALNIEFPDGDFDTIGGYLMSLLGRIPDQTEKPMVESCGYRFQIEKIEDRRIERIRAEKLADESQSDEQSESGR